MAISTIDMPTRAGSVGPRVIEQSPDSNLNQQIMGCPLRHRSLSAVAADGARVVAVDVELHSGGAAGDGLLQLH